MEWNGMGWDGMGWNGKERRSGSCAATKTVKAGRASLRGPFAATSHFEPKTAPIVRTTAASPVSHGERHRRLRRSNPPRCTAATDRSTDRPTDRPTNLRGDDRCVGRFVRKRGRLGRALVPRRASARRGSAPLSDETARSILPRHRRRHAEHATAVAPQRHRRRHAELDHLVRHGAAVAPLERGKVLAVRAPRARAVVDAHARRPQLLLPSARGYTAGKRRLYGSHIWRLPGEVPQLVLCPPAGVASRATVAGFRGRSARTTASTAGRVRTNDTKKGRARARSARLDSVRRAEVARELGLEPLGEHALDLSR